MSTRNTLAPTPPMGWNSFTGYDITVREDEVLANARYQATHLAHLGWEYVVVDGMWYQDTGPLPGETPWTPEPLMLDEYGRLLPNLRRFPSAANGAGLKPLADAVHALGLKFGLHIMRGIPRRAVKQHLPILGTPYQADEVADQAKNCGWYDGMYGVNMAHPGGQAYYDSILALYAAWGVDYIKADDCADTPYHLEEIEGIARAIERCGRPIVLSLSTGDKNSTLYAEHRKAHAELWRIGPDLHDEWAQVDDTFDFLPRWMPHIGPGHWADPDMLPFGMIHLRRCITEHTGPHMTKLTRDEQLTVITLWCISRSPLMFAGALPQNDEWTLSLITNPEVLAVNQHSTGNRELLRHHDFIVWAARASEGDGHYLAFFNRGETPLTMPLPLAEVALPRCAVRDLWAQEDYGTREALQLDIPPHGTRLYRLTPA